MTDDGRYVLITVRNGCDPVNKLFYVDLEKINYRISGNKTTCSPSMSCR